MSIYNLAKDTSKNSPIRAAEAPTKYTDVAFANKVAETSGKSVMSSMMTTVKSYQSSTSQTATGTNPGAIPGK